MTKQEKEAQLEEQAIAKNPNYLQTKKLLLQCIIMIIIVRIIRNISLNVNMGSSEAGSLVFGIDIIYFIILCLFVSKAYKAAILILFIEAIYACITAIDLFSNLHGILNLALQVLLLFVFTITILYIVFAKDIKQYFTQKKEIRLSLKLFTIQGNRDNADDK